jgi:hypothetical protein
VFSAECLIRCFGTIRGGPGVIRLLKIGRPRETLIPPVLGFEFAGAGEISGGFSVTPTIGFEIAQSIVGQGVVWVGLYRLPI